MTKEEAITEFAQNRPKSRCVYGYGSGVFKQASSTGKPLTDVIFLVDDLKKWHHQNMDMNPDDYSFIGRVYISKNSVDKIKGVNGVTYFSEINGGEYTFKYGVIEQRDFTQGLESWNNLFMAGRFHKPVLEIRSEQPIRDAILENRRYALIIASIFCDRVCSKKDIYQTICGLSYIGDARMAIAENPHKVENIVQGSFEKIEELYPLKENFIIPLANDMYFIDYDLLLNRISELPPALLTYLYDIDTDFTDLEMLRINIYEYISSRNKIESRAQIIHGIKTNGIIRSLPYALSKVKKRFSR